MANRIQDSQSRAPEALWRFATSEKPWSHRHGRRIVCGSVLALLAIGALVARLTLISGSMPYVGHIDEMEISGRAERILQTGDFNPHFFEYPSLPIYLAAAGFVVGFLDACGKRKIHTTAQIGSVDYPYYQQPTVVYPARALFAVLSVLSLVLLGLVVHELTGFEAGLFLPPLLASASTFYLNLSWKYLNVDIVGAFFVVATLFYLLRTRRRRWSSRDSLVSGALCGLTIACKYPLFPILLPGLLTVWLSASRRKWIDSYLLVVAAVAAFLAATPYALLDFATFLNDVGGAVSHYARGHPGAEGEPGWSQIAYYLSHIVREFGPLSPLFALVGVIFLLSVDWRGGVTFLSFPIAHLAYMSLQRVHFIRHVASSYLIFAALLAIGLIVSFLRITDRVAGYGFWARGHRFPAFAIGAAAIALFAATLPWRKIADAYDLTPDSRSVAVHWIKEHLPLGATILVPPELGLRTGPLQDRFRILPIHFGDLDPNAPERDGGSYVLLPRFGFDPRRVRGQELAAARNAAVARLDARVLVELGSAAVTVNYPEPVTGGNPSIRIAVLQDEHAPDLP
jgi:Dolichyl-phosphate-mannose-protein mannosyltransferase